MTAAKVTCCHVPSKRLDTKLQSLICATSLAVKRVQNFTSVADVPAQDARVLSSPAIQEITIW